MKKLS